MATKNGNKEGTTEVAQRLIPDLTAVKLEFENIKIEMVKNKNKREMKFRFNFNTIKLFFNNMKSSFILTNERLDTGIKICCKNGKYCWLFI